MERRETQALSLRDFTDQESPLRSRCQALQHLRLRRPDQRTAALRATAIAKDHNRNHALREILLKANVLIGCQKYFKRSFVRRFQQFAVAQRIPTKVFCLFDRVAGEEKPERRGRAMVK